MANYTAIFRTENLESLLFNKYVVLIGDSVQRSVYKDLVVLYHENRFMAQSELRKKGEESFLGDRLVERSELTNGTNYKEVREFKKEHIHLKFYFITRVYNDYVESIVEELEDRNTPDPDVVIMNSCLWDVSRYGVNSMEKYKTNLKKLCCRLKDVLPKKTLVVWRTTLPVSEEMKGGFMTSDAEWCRDVLKLNVWRANYFAWNILSEHRFDVVDMHNYFSGQLHRPIGDYRHEVLKDLFGVPKFDLRAKDGVHWNMYAHRRMTNLLLTHIAAAWNEQVPDYPWADDSVIEFSPDEIQLNTTNVLLRAYQPDHADPLLPPPPKGLNRPKPALRSVLALPKPQPRRRSLAEERYGGPIRSTQEMYSGYYDLPQEEPNLPYDENGNYWILPQEPVQRKMALPTDPYPQYYSSQWNQNVDYTADTDWNANTNSGPMRYAKKWSTRRQTRRPGRASEMIQKRMRAEQAERRQINIAFRHQQEPFHPIQNRRKVEWSHFSRHHPRYVPYGLCEGR